MGFYDFFHSELGLKCCDKLAGLIEISQSSGWFWPFREAVILTERPVSISRDGDNRLHNLTGPSLLYPDGFGVWAINGLRVDKQIIEAPETLTFEQVRDERNAEVRRHMLDRFAGLRGSAAAGAWLKAGNLEPVSQVDITDKMQPSGLSIWKLSNGDKPVLCKLYRAEMVDDEPLVLLWVVCTSTAKEVFLRVPPFKDFDALRPSLINQDASWSRDWTFSNVPLHEAVET